MRGIMNISELKKENEQLQAQVQYLRNKLGEGTPTAWVSKLELKFLKYVAEHAVMPKYKYVVTAFGWKSHNSVTQKVDQLSRKGLMKKTDHGWVLTRSGKEIVEKE